MSEKTEHPTPRRLKRAREQGDSPVSGALVQAAAFVAALMLAPAAIAAIASRMRELVLRSLGSPELTFSAASMATEVLVLSVPVVLAAAVAAAAIGLVQTGGVIAAQKLAPELGRMNPVTGLENLFSWQRGLGVLRALVAALVVGWLAVRLLLDRAPDLAATVGSPTAAGAIAGVLSERLGLIAALVGLALAGVDLVVTHFSWIKRLRMSRDEVKREFREAEGDPEIKAARQRAHLELLHQAALAAVRDATVLIVNPTHLATALRYTEDEDSAPRVLAHGAGDLAQRMIDAARAYGVPIVRDVPVAHALRELEVGDEIPEALYEAVAEILREVWEQGAESQRSKTAED
jgi:flagellar biosynthesis protein FlhB